LVEKFHILITFAISVAILSCGCLAPGSSGTQQVPPPTFAVPLTIVINTTPSRYNPAMSSTIGIRLTPVNISGILPPDAVFTWETDFGTFYHWGPPDFKVVELTPRYTGMADPVYWSYFSELGEKNPPPVNVTLRATESVTGKTLANATLHIGWEDPLGFTSIVEGP
jgi:hypothetical protein